MENKIKEILSNFTEEVQKLYYTDAMFNRCVHAIARGTSPFEVIGTFVLCHQEMTKQLIEFANLLPPQPITKPFTQ